jgi:hypothetical protein
MSLGALQDEADLKRWLEQQLQTPGVLPQNPQPAIALTKAGVPADSDFPNPPGNGILALDSTGPTLYARLAGEWKAL